LTKIDKKKHSDIIMHLISLAGYEPL